MPRAQKSLIESCWKICNPWKDRCEIDEYAIKIIAIRTNIQIATSTWDSSPDALAIAFTVDDPNNPPDTPITPNINAGTNLPNKI